MSKPIIAVLGSHMTSGNNSAPVLADFVNTAYCTGVRQAGGTPLLLPVPEEPDAMDDALALCDGLLIPGGKDVDPRFYDEDPCALIGSLEADMDRFWIHATKYASEHKMPVLGICRGIQLVNVAFGGSLYQDLSYLNPGHNLHSQEQRRDYLTHKVFIEPDSRLAEILGVTSIYTNTMHHQCIKELAKGFRITAHTNDGIPEAMEDADGQFILVQWHPEELRDTEPKMRRLFENLVERAKRFHGRSFF